MTTVYVGPDEPDNAAMFDECRLGRAGDAVPLLFDPPLRHRWRS